jgi:hypothetical protein
MEEMYFKEDRNGVHIMQLSCMDEGSLCGIGCDNPDLKKTRKKIVTCKMCIHILKILSNVKYKNAE